MPQDGGSTQLSIIQQEEEEEEENQVSLIHPTFTHRSFLRHPPAPMGDHCPAWTQDIHSHPRPASNCHRYRRGTEQLNQHHGTAGHVCLPTLQNDTSYRTAGEETYRG